MLSILMTTYNGEKYLSEQVESILSQSISDLVLYIQDDCSTDNTWELLQELAQREPERIILSKTEKNTGGTKYNFYDLMSRIRDDYIMLCDQDDVWLPEKIEKTLAKMRELETEYGKDEPLLVHTDLIVVDGNLKQINPSFKAAMNANYNRTRLQDQLIQNTLTGCTALYNRALAKLILPQIPNYMVMHDWWLMLVAAAFGHIDHIEDQTILYRQHGNNEIGAKDVRTLQYKINKLINYKDIKQAINDTYKQAYSLLKYYKDTLSYEQITLMETYCRIPTMNKLNRWRTICRLGVLKNGAARKIANFIFI